MSLILLPNFHSIMLNLEILDSAAVVHGAPIAIQLITRTLHDEDLLAIGSVVGACLKA